MPSLFNFREWLTIAVFSVGLTTATFAAIVGFSLNPVTAFLLALAVLVGSTFGEFRDTWGTERQFSLARVFFRTFEWLSLAVAGYIILSVIGVNGSPSE